MKEQPDESFLSIDLDRLDKEWVGQPLLMYQYSTKLADARLRYDTAKSELDVTEAEIDNDIRTNPTEYGFKKDERVTESAIKAKIKEHADFQTAQQRVFKLKHHVEIYQAAVNALDHRKKALESLVSLHGQQYFASPRVGGKAREVMEEATKQHVRKLGQKRYREADDEEKE